MARALAIRSRTLFISSIGIEGIIEISGRPRRIERLDLDVVGVKKFPCWSSSASRRRTYNVE
jgi:hypothetical protein